jgi:hypothetical protein
MEVVEDIRLCIKCGLPKPIDAFYGSKNTCKSCKIEYQKAYYIANKVIINEKQHSRYIENKEQIIADQLRRDKDRKEEIAVYQKEYRKNNKDKARIYAKKKKQKPENKIREAISTSVRRSLKSNGFLKNGVSFFEKIGYTPEDLRQHIISQFEPWMNLNNFGQYNPDTWDEKDKTTWTWNIDHKKPHSEFNYKTMDDIEFKECWALDNLRPYPAKDNIYDGSFRIRHKDKKE